MDCPCFYGCMHILQHRNTILISLSKNFNEERFLKYCSPLYIRRLIQQVSDVETRTVL